MIVLDGPGLIVVRTRKTASTSLEIALSALAGPDDIITSLSPRDEELRRTEGGRPPQNHLHPGLHAGPAPAPPGVCGRVRFYNHMPARHLRAELGAPWERYVSVAVERNPFEKVASLYFHRHRNPHLRPSMEEFIATGEFADALNWPLYTDHDGRVMVDHLLRHEHLEEQLADLCELVGLPPLRLPHAKAHFRPPGLHYRDVLDAAARQAVEEAYTREFDLLEYRW
ncbi:sulfotransferase family protein [Actinocorallia populi]|uniref:hypothetical protein n=1 Tax=Actinocorallia populi TaxID=2079200 RepID=UPI000D08B638|nr:hypothetical protein [Actinocorallia populi]